MSKFDDLLNKEMTRKEFVKTLGIGVVSLFGLSALLGMLHHDTSPKKMSPSAYGERTYGH